MPLTMISAEPGFVIFEDEDGDEILQTPGPIAINLTYWDEIDLSDVWQTAVRDYRATGGHRFHPPDREAFMLKLRQTVADYYSAEVVWCENCDEPVKSEDSVSVNDGDASVCSSCYEDNYRSCDDCDSVVCYDDLNSTLGEDSVCDQCRARYYTWCDECNGYYNDNYSYDHEHNGGCDCEAPAQTFTLRNNGEAPVAQDERVTIGLPAGVISEEGVNQIARLIRDHGCGLEGDDVAEERNKWWTLSYEVPAMDARWQTKEGNFTKRLSKLAHKSQGLKTPPEMLSSIGNIARDNSNGSTVELEFTRDLNQSAEDFYHEDSCWWQSYYESRCALKSNGGIGMRTFGGAYGNVSGRAWVMPLYANEDGDLRPTFESMTPDAFVVFNGYGELSGYTPARIMAHMAGMTYRKISFTCSPMYVNGNQGYLVAPEEIATKYTDSALHLYVNSHSNLYRLIPAA